MTAALMTEGQPWGAAIAQTAVRKAEAGQPGTTSVLESSGQLSGGTNAT